MARVKRGTVSRQKHKKVLGLAKGYRGTRSKLIKTAQEAVLHANQYSFHGRKRRKRDMRRLWITRITGAVQEQGHSYSTFINMLRKKNIELDRKTMAGIIVNDPQTFTTIVKQAFESK